MKTTERAFLVTIVEPNVLRELELNKYFRINTGLFSVDKIRLLRMLFTVIEPKNNEAVVCI